MDRHVQKSAGLEQRAASWAYRALSSQDADVIIAVPGIAGAPLALALHQAGLKPILIDPVVFDAQVAPTFDGRASAIAYAAFRQWRALGLAPALEPHAHRVEQSL